MDGGGTQGNLFVAAGLFSTDIPNAGKSLSAVVCSPVTHLDLMDTSDPVITDGPIKLNG